MGIQRITSQVFTKTYLRQGLGRARYLVKAPPQRTFPLPLSDLFARSTLRSISFSILEFALSE
eukprot:12937115-Prorocentrum_lima.AAC.1